MNAKMKTMLAFCGVLVLSGCAWQQPTGQAYWERVEDKSALWMTGPKAQQQLDQDIAGCVREVDELVEIGALRETTPPDTHGEYHRALKASGDLDYYDTPTRYGSHMVSHTDYHDFDSCMRFKGWERVKFIRYQTARQSQETYGDTQSIRMWGLAKEQAVAKQKEKVEAIKDNYAGLNN